MQVSSSGTTDLQALVMFVVDASKPFATPETFLGPRHKSRSIFAQRNVPVRAFACKGETFVHRGSPQAVRWLSAEAYAEEGEEQPFDPEIRFLACRQSPARL
jgi:hypothetical protein